MKRVIYLLALLLCTMAGVAQIDTTKPYTKLYNLPDYPNGIRAQAITAYGDTVALRAADTGSFKFKGGQLYVWSRIAGVYKWSAATSGGSGITSLGITSSTLDASPNPITSNGNITLNLKPISGAINTYSNPTVTIDQF